MVGWRVPIVLAVLLILIGVAVPPVIEDHLEAGFCSADCPVQHPGHGAGITPSLVALAAQRAHVVVAGDCSHTDVALDTSASPDAPRAPPSA